ncbi:MAG: bifunctional 2-methylcitrate synthase/citrate synthase [Bdellovibrionales bacterium]|nr:bifunctional 2-methylcitrate synthase/citrate synthase [Bdellovibrionales bacterium]
MSEIKKGLDGVVVDETQISKVMPDINSLVYRGYPVQDLAENCRFEEIAYLLFHEDLPTTKLLEAFEKDERGRREISKDLVEVIRKFNKKCHPMDSIRTAVSFLGAEGSSHWDHELKEKQDRSMDLLAKIPTMIAADFRFKKGQDFIPPRKDLTIAENFFHLCFGEVPSKEVVRAFDVSLILYAEHSFNASTFTSRVITSTTSDIFSAVVGGIGALKGPLHGGANEQVMHMMLEVGEPDKAAAWMKKALADKRKIMGFGHRVYKNGDSRVPTMKKYAQKMADATGGQKWMKMYDELAKVMLDEKNIYPNLDFPAGPAYYMMGFDIDFFTPIFVMSRITGWCAHVMEQSQANRLIRPLSAYTGHKERKVTSITSRN